MVGSTESQEIDALTNASWRRVREVSGLNGTADFVLFAPAF
jgi:hypothetical protein